MDKVLELVGGGSLTNGSTPSSLHSNQMEMFELFENYMYIENIAKYWS